MTALAPTLPLRRHSLLRSALWFDAVSVAGLALPLFLLAAPLAPWLGLDAAWLRTVGAGLLPFAAFLAFIASRECISRVAVGWIIALNGLYVIDSFAILGLGWVQPTPLGATFIVLQALVAAAVAAAEWIGLRREAVAAG